MNKFYVRILMVFGSITLLASCAKQAPKDYLIFSGTIDNRVSDSIFIYQGRALVKALLTDNQGVFSDSLKVERGLHTLYTGGEYATLYLKNGEDLQLQVDAKAFDESLTFSGKGAPSNNYLLKELLLSSEIFNYEEMMAMQPDAFKAKLDNNISQLTSLLESTIGLDTTMVRIQKARIADSKKAYESYFEEQQHILALRGQPSPSFKDYENFKGGQSSLADFKGKYVYIDLWATWCGPCIAEIPALKELEQDYHDKNIAFLSISVDRKSAYKKWRSMVVDKELGGVQLWAKEDQTFMDDYMVKGIPRFILIDPQGFIIEASAPRPSEKHLRDLLDELPI